MFKNLNFKNSLKIKNFKLKIETGFTLIELLVSVAIVLIITTFSASFFSRFLLQNDVANTTDTLVGSFRKAQIYSMMGKQNGAWGVHYASNTLTLFQGNSYAGRTLAFDETYSLNSNISFSGWSDVVFTKMTGTPSASPTITISSSNSTKTVIVNSIGVVSR